MGRQVGEPSTPSIPIRRRMMLSRCLPRARRAKQKVDTDASEVEDVKEVLDEYPPELTCCVCFGLFDDPVAWPGSEQCKEHPLCRSCLIRCVETQVRCPVCRAPPPLNFYFAGLWTLDSIDAIQERIQQSYPERLPKRIAGSPVQLSTASYLLFEGFDERKDVRKGAKVTIMLREPRHLLLLAKCMVSKTGTVRFAVLCRDQARGYIAGVYAGVHNLGRSLNCSTTREAIYHLLFHHTSTRQELPNLMLKVLLIDTFRLAGPPKEAPVEKEALSMLNGTQWRMTPSSQPLREAPLVVGLR